MNLLALETSCDETAVAVFNFATPTTFSILSEQLNSQIELHKEYGGVFPALAKREHTKNTYPLIIAALDESNLLQTRQEQIEIPHDLKEKISLVLDRDAENLERLISMFETYKIPAIDALAVTYGPGLEIALWTGFNIARALSILWDCELVPTNHMEGHIYASLIQKQEDDSFQITLPAFPALSLLVSGGHTELVLIEQEHQYKKIGVTQDDAVGEAFDKSARLIDIPYPGGPQISKLADAFRESGQDSSLSLPRPMIHSGDLNFSYSGLKTAVRSLIESQNEITDSFKKELAFELEEAITETLEKKTSMAIMEYGPTALILGGGVSANNTIRKRLGALCEESGIDYFIPDRKYSGDNAVMIGIAGYRRLVNKKHDPLADRVVGRLSLES